MLALNFLSNIQVNPLNNHLFENCFNRDIVEARLFRGIGAAV